MSEAIKSLTAQGLEQLCSEEQLQLLNAVDSLRSQGISHYISLPQIIVCGDQSSGKSSVLESISGVPFPTKSSVCTRFPTELILRKTAFPSINVSIVPHHSCNDADKDSLSNFRERLLDFKDLPALIESAKLAMGVMTMGKAFSEDILRIEVSGPDRPHLTIVDLPGLIHSSNKHQSASDIDLINNVVQRYMKEPRSIILAVVSAKNDYVNQIVLKLASKADPEGKRTLGVITKPDTLIPGSGSERDFISLARNQDVEFRLGWHVLRNRDTEADQEGWTFEQRDAAELQLLSSGAWAGLSVQNVGIKSLRTRLSKVLVRQISSELPSLIDEITKLSAECQKRLQKLGLPRNTIYEQRMYLIQISQAFQALLQAAANGAYNDSYFGNAMSSVGYQKRLRAVVQSLNRGFAAKMAFDGRRYEVVEDGEEVGSERHGHLTRDQYIEKIVLVIQKGRGRELPGMFNPMIVTELFKELSSPWGKIAEDHVLEVWKAIRLSLNHLVTHVADSTTVNSILAGVFEPHLDSLLKVLREKLSGLLKPHRTGHPITYNHYFTEALQNIRKEREKCRLAALIQEEFGAVSLVSKTSISRTMDFGQFLERLLDPREADMDHFAASDALDCLDAYYKVIEVCLLGKLNEIMDPTSIFTMKDADITRIAAETEESRAARAELETKLKVLSNGSQICKTFATLYVNVLDNENESSDNTTDRLSDTGSEQSATGSVATAGSDVDLADSSAPEAVLADDLIYEAEQVVEQPHTESTPESVDDVWGGVSRKSKKAKKNQKKRAVFDKAKLVEAEPTLEDDNLSITWGRKTK
ncbi:Dynamin, GTPase domain protein [Cordyceps fumosorosea ARSEF 2679]|uniref:Dynamin, GTPase domain protein n=1 Tax=Cordyceps fumosorosea (strain ARSEF 2679) TaxID=1081104 RepID=A0A166WZS9_CORFA|nr:Dynamin, GTPase domain protein [Cordyceps fumosorosea ARSEF 2679]OAA35270.1 Dynamin, GTPase domain protein [Cordyceps fumosorosea ARSEF 2679]